MVWIFFKSLAYVFDSRDCRREERSSCPSVMGAVAAGGEGEPQDTLEQHLRYPGRGGLSAGSEVPCLSCHEARKMAAGWGDKGHHEASDGQIIQWPRAFSWQPSFHLPWGQRCLVAAVNSLSLGALDYSHVLNHICSGLVLPLSFTEIEDNEWALLCIKNKNNQNPCYYL